MPRTTTANKRSRKRRSEPHQGLAAFASERRAPLFASLSGQGLKTAKFLVGLLLLPVCWVLLETFLILLRADTIAGNYWRSREFLFFGIGCLLSLALFFFWRTRLTMWLYVAGHELTHALFVLICRGRVSKVHISAEGGHILTNRNNFLISLSPYFFPFYTVVSILGWAVACWILAERERPDAAWLYALIGFTWMFHLVFTVWMTRREQPDLDQNGRFFSTVIIFIANVLVICTLLILASPTATFRGFGISVFANGSSLLGRFVESVKEVWELLPY